MFTELSSNSRNQRKNDKVLWFIIPIFIVIILGLLAAGAAKISSVAYPLGAIAIGFFLYGRHPIAYVNFTVSILLLGHLITRLIGYQIGDLAPFGGALLLIPFISVISLIKNLPELYKKGDFLPFALCLGSIFYAILIRLIRQPLGDLK
jgi:hypothetical protein